MLRRTTRQTNQWEVALHEQRTKADEDATPRRGRIRLGRLRDPLRSVKASTGLRWRPFLWLLLCVVLMISMFYAIWFTPDYFLLYRGHILSTDDVKMDQQALPSRTPIVNRTVVADLAAQRQDTDSNTGPSVVSLRWPPLVTVIPEVRPSTHSIREGLSAASVDAQFCRGQSRCRLLLPLWIGEQESRGRIHLTQVLHLAAALNRTVVLPNVGKSRVGACGKWDFSAYYDTGSFARQLKTLAGDSAQPMLMDDFKTWVSMRPQSPVGQVVFFHERAAISSEQANILVSEDTLSLSVDSQMLEAQDARLKNAFCLKTKFRKLRLDLRRPLSLYANVSDATSLSSLRDTFSALFRREDILQATARYDTQDLDPVVPQDVLETDELADASSTDPDVLVVHWDLRHLPFATSPTTPGLAYSEKLWELASLLAPPSDPYLAVHWRMETVEPSLLPDCAEALVDTLSIILADPTLAKDIKTVWLATDMPGSLSPSVTLQGPTLRSNTFKVITSQHTEAQTILKAAFDHGGPLEDWKVTGLAEQMQRIRSELLLTKRTFSLGNGDDDNLIWEDPGIWGILDKIVAMESTFFVSGARGCGRISSFTRQIVDYRSQGQSKTVPRNIVELFG